MTLIATLLQSATAAAEPISRASEMPEFASAALLSVVLAGLSMVVRRSGGRDEHRDSRTPGVPRP